MMNCLRALLRGVAAAAAAAGIAGCATPNMQPFADHTALLANAVSAEQREISVKFDQLTIVLHEACETANRAKRHGQEFPDDPCAQENRRKNDKPIYDDAQKAIDTLMEHSVYYANSLAELAKAGDTGSAAAESLLGTVAKFGSLFGAAPGFVSATVTKAVTTISDAVTKIQAQKSLGEATMAANDTITAVANAIDVIFKDANDNIVVALRSDENQAILDIAGHSLVALFQNAALSREVISQKILQRQNELVGQRCIGFPSVGADAQAVCKSLAEELKTAEDLNRLLDRLRPEYDAYLAKRAATTRWLKERSDSSVAIRKAVMAWKGEHTKLAAELKRCGGLNAYRCVEINAATIKLFADRINEIRSAKGQ